MSFCAIICGITSSERAQDLFSRVTKRAEEQIASGKYDMRCRRLWNA